MINKLISLALLIFFLTTGYGYSDSQFLFPKKKPSIFKKIERNIASEIQKNLPQKKPIIQTDDQKDNVIKTKKITEKKIELKKEETVIKKIIKSNQGIYDFLLPKKNQSLIKFSLKKLKNLQF